MPVEAGQVIAERYRLVRPIGKGAQAAVWIAEHLALGSQVAIKIMDPELVEQADARERFRREASAAAQLRSAHVVHILDHGIENGQPFMVMEYLDGEDLFARLERKGRLTLVEASVIVTQIARALARAHAAGIVHRDLKPENVYLVPNEDEEVAKVLDFGVAKFLEAGAAQRRTSAGTLLGTPHYMSPEQVRGVGDIDHRSDLWSLGVIAYQLTVGDLPFESEGVGDLLIKITMEKIPVPSKAYAPLPRSFDEWFARACHRDPDKRFQTGRELAEGLARVAGLIPAGAAAPIKGRSEPPAFDVDFDELPSIPPPPAPPAPSPPIAASAPATRASDAAIKPEDIDDEWPDEPPAPSIPPPPVAAALAAGKGPPPRPGAKAAATPTPPPAQAKAAAPAKPDMPTRGPRLPPPTAADLRIAPPSMPTQPDPEEARPRPRAEMPPPSPTKADAKSAPEPAPAKPVAAKAAPAPEPAPAPKAAAAAPARASTPSAAPAPPPPPRPTRSSAPPSSSRSSDAPRSKNQLSSTISGAAGDVIPPPELDGSRKKRAVAVVAVFAVIGACAIAFAVVRSQGPTTPVPAAGGPTAKAAEPRPSVAEPPPAPVATPSTSASAASSAAIDPGQSKRPIKGDASAAPPRRPGGNRPRPPPKDGEIVIDVPLPEREVPVPASP